MTPADFVSELLPYARQVQAARGIDAWAVLTQWALETGWGTSTLFVVDHNVAGIKHTDPHTGELVFWSYSDLQAGVNDYIATLGLGFYTGVLATAGQGVEATLRALGQSPWDAGHYGSPPGQSLVNLWETVLAPLAGTSTPTIDPTSAYRDLYVAVVGLAHALGSDIADPPWAAVQGLTPDHLGHVPSLADGASYLSAQLWSLALWTRTNWPGGIVNATVAAPAAVPSGATDPTVLLAPIYVGLVDVAHAVGTSLLGPPWAAAQGLSGEHFGHPPTLDDGVSYLEGQASALVAHITSGTSTTPPPAGGGGGATTPPGGGGGAPPPESGGGTGIPAPLPGPVPSPGPGVSGLLTAWDQLRTLVNVTLPELAARVDADLAALTGGGGTGPRPQ